MSSITAILAVVQGIVWKQPALVLKCFTNYKSAGRPVFRHRTGCERWGTVICLVIAPALRRTRTQYNIRGCLLNTCKVEWFRFIFYSQREMQRAKEQGWNESYLSGETGKLGVHKMCRNSPGEVRTRQRLDVN